MPDQDTMLLQGQQELLRQIRDELRQGGNGSGAGIGGNVRGRQAYQQFRSVTDSMAIGNWANGQWADAYKSQIRQGMTGEFFGGIGFFRAPAVMTQLEYQYASADAFGARLGSIPASVLAPSFVSNTRKMTEDLFTFSPRFARFGDADAGPAGSGISLSSSRQVARELGVAAAGDLRMDSAGYRTVLSGGLQSGQFDHVRSTDELVKAFTTLKDTVADLTRVTRMSTDEMTTLMGQLRQAGVQNVGDQRRVVETLNAHARVAGVAMAEMMPGAGAAITAGLGMGLAAHTSAGLFGANLSSARSMSRSGLVSTNLMAQAGGAASYASAATQAQQGFLASTPGAIAYLAGRGDGFLNPMLSGAAAIGGDFNSMLMLPMMMPDLLEQAGSGAAEGMFDSAIREKAALLGGGAAMTQRLAYEQALQGGMSPQQAAIYARRFSAGGRADMARTAYGAVAAKAAGQAALAYDKYHMNTSSEGAMQRVFAGVRSGFTGALDSVSNVFETDQTSGMFWMSGTAEQQLTALRLGSTADSMSFDDRLDAVTGRAASGRPSRAGYRFAGSNTGGTVGSVVGMTGGGLLAGGLAAAALASNPIGWTIAGVGAAAAIGGVGGYYGGGAWGAAVQDAPGQLAEQQVATLLAMQQANASYSESQGRERAIRFGGNEAFVRAAQKYAGSRTLSANQTLDLQNEIQQMATVTNSSVGDITQALRAVGASPVAAEMFQDGFASGKHKISASLNDISSRSNFMTVEGAKGAAAYLRATTNRDKTAAMAALTATGEDRAQFFKNVDGMSAEQRAADAAGFTNIADVGKSLAGDRMHAPVIDRLRSLLGENAGQALAGANRNSAGLVRDVIEGKGIFNQLGGSERRDPMLQYLRQFDSAGNVGDIAKLTGMSETELEASYKRFSANQGGSFEAFRRGIAVMSLSGSQYKKTEESSVTTNAASAISAAANALVLLEKRLSK